MQHLRLAALCSIGALGCATAQPEGRARPLVDLILTHGRVVLPHGETASAIGVRDGKIVAIGGDEVLQLASATTTVTDLAGAAVLPGLRDAHVHLRALGRLLTGAVLDLSATRSEAEVVAAVGRWIGAHPPPPGAWVEGFGWSEASWGTSLPSSTAPLDAVAPDHPVVLVRGDGHTAWVNRRALVAGGLDRASTLSGGQAFRNGAGELTGVVTDQALAAIHAHRPPPPDAEVEAEVKAALTALAQLGVVEAQDAAVDPQVDRLLHGLARRGELPLRVYALLSYPLAGLEARLAQPPEEDLYGRLTVRAVKLFADGAFAADGAHLRTAYADRPGWTGTQRVPPDLVRRVARLCLARGYQLATHAIGDRAVEEVLDAYQEPLTGRVDARFRVEHVGLVADGDVGRFSRLGVIASMQAWPAGPGYAPRLGSERAALAWDWTRLWATGVHIAMGSDMPTGVSADPRVGLARIALRARKDEPRAGFDEILAMYTREPAFAAFEESRRGEIAVGKDADLTVLASDPRESGLVSVPSDPVLSTYVGGVRVYARYDSHAHLTAN
jgi:predicted amidohydrolase YtcJ